MPARTDCPHRLHARRGRRGNPPSVRRVQRLTCHLRLGSAIEDMDDPTPTVTMPDDRTCPQCGAPLRAGASDWLCPRCLLSQVAGATATEPIPDLTSTRAPRILHYLGDYEL